MDSNISFGKFIRDRRIEKGYTLRKFAAKVDLSSAFVSRMERDEVSPPSEEKIINIARILSLNPDHLTLMAKKVPLTVQEMLMDRPKLVAFLRTANEKTDQELDGFMTPASEGEFIN